MKCSSIVASTKNPTGAVPSVTGKIMLTTDCIIRQLCTETTPQNLHRTPMLKNVPGPMTKEINEE